MLKPNRTTLALSVSLACAAACGPAEEPAPDVLELTIQSISDADEDFVADAMGWDTFATLPLEPDEVFVYAGYVDAEGVAQLKRDPITPRAIDDRTLGATVELGVPPAEFVVDGVAVSFIVAIDQALPDAGDLADLADDVRLDLRQPRYQVGGDEEGLERLGWDRAFLQPASEADRSGRFVLRADGQ